MRRIAGGLGPAFCGAAWAQPAAIAPLSASTDSQIPPPWQIITLAKIPRHTQYSVVTLDGQRVVKAAADRSYANVVHAS